MPHSFPIHQVVPFASFACPTEACLDYQNANPDYPKLEKEMGVSGSDRLLLVCEKKVTAKLQLLLGEDLEPFKHNHPFDYEDSLS